MDYEILIIAKRKSKHFEIEVRIAEDGLTLNLPIHIRSLEKIQNILKDVIVNIENQNNTKHQENLK